MKERAFLAVCVLVLFGGLGVWAAVARRDRPEPTAVVARLPAPPIGEPVPESDAATLTERRALELAMLRGLPLVRVATRARVPIHALVLPGRDALGAWDRLRQGSAESGRWPVLLGDGWSVRAHADATRATSDGPEPIVRRARALDLDAWIASRLARVEPPEGQWPEDAGESPPARFRVLRDELDLPVAELALALIPTREAAEVPAWLAFGNWSECPEPTVHVAMIARWQERYGAEIVAVTRDTIELRVTRPPADRDAATALAREQIAYAPSLLAQGTRSVAEIAASRIGATTWSLTWPRLTRPE